MATIHPHPTLLQSPSHIQAFQQRHGVLIVLGYRGPQVIPALHYRLVQHAPQVTGYTGPEAA